MKICHCVRCVIGGWQYTLAVQREWAQYFLLKTKAPGSIKIISEQNCVLFRRINHLKTKCAAEISVSLCRKQNFISRESCCTCTFSKEVIYMYLLMGDNGDRSGARQPVASVIQTCAQHCNTHLLPCVIINSNPMDRQWLEIYDMHVHKSEKWIWDRNFQ